MIFYINHFSLILSGVWITSCPGKMVLRFEDFEKTEVGYSTVEGAVEFSTVEACS